MNTYYDQDQRDRHYAARENAYDYLIKKTKEHYEKAEKRDQAIAAGMCLAVLFIILII